MKTLSLCALIVLSTFTLSIAWSGEKIKGIPSGKKITPTEIKSLAALPHIDPRSINATATTHNRPEAMEFSEEEMERMKAAPKPGFDGKGILTIDPSAPSPQGPMGITSTPNLSVNFEGNLQAGSIPGDLMVAVGPNHVVSVTNSTVRIRNKTGAVLQTVGANVFFGLPFASASIWYDPKVTYDVLENRFVLLFDANGNDAGSAYWIAISQTSNALGGWWVYTFDMSLDGTTPTTNWADFPGLGFDDNCVYMTGNMFTVSATPSFQYIKTRVVSKFFLYNGFPTDYVDILDAPGTGSHFTLKPAISMSHTTTEYLAITPSGGGSAVQLYTITGGPASPALEKIGHLSVSGWGVPPDGVQKDCPADPVDGGDARVGDPVWRDGMLYAVHAVGKNIGGTDVAAIKYYKINTSIPSVEIDELYGAPSTFYIYPGVTVDAVGTAYFSFSRTSADEYATAGFTGRRRFDTAMQPSGLLRAGSVAYRCGFAKDASGRNRWGDYTGVAIDPSETGNARSAAWADGNWAKGTNTWGSWIGKIAFNYHLIRGQVFHDCDSSAATSTDRLPLKDVKVLIERESVVFDSTTTDSTGSYKFGFLDDGTYDVIVSLPVDSWAVDALPGTGGDVQTKINETTLEVELSGASTASDTSSNNDFLIVVTHPVPVISSISPDMYSVGEPEFDLAVYGSDFVPCSIVGVDGADRVTTYVSPTEVHATVLASDISSLGTRSITVFNPLPGGGESNTATLTVHSPAPVFSLHPLLIDFGSSLQGVTKTDCVMVVNTGTADLLISGVTSDNSQFNATPSGATIHRQDSLKFDLTFNPSVIGATSGHIIFTHNADTTPDSADVTGTGLDSTTFRTATANDWASAVDAKGKHKAFPHKPDKVFFKLSLTSPSNASLCTILDLTFSMPIGSLVAYTFPAKSDTIPYSSLTFDTKRKVWRYTFSPPLAPNTTIQIDGIGLQGKLIKVSKYIWADAGFASTQKGKVPDVGSSFLKNVPGMPRPNLVNVMDELFPKGFGQVSTYFSDVNPLILGSPQGTGGARSVKLLKSTNVVKSFIDEKTGTKHTHDPLCLTDVNVPKQLTLFSPLKINDNIAAELLALKLNIAASIAMKFPPGFGELEFYDAGSPSQPFNHKPVKDIAKYVDSLLSCLTIQGISPSPDLNSALQALLKINGEFQDAGNQKDTISFFAKSRLHGVKSVGVAAYLRKVPGAVPETFTASDNGNADVPLVYALHQNYPNPFNPTTMISFELPEPAIVTLRIFNVLGQAVSVPLDHQMLDDGAHDFEFEGKMLPSGVYFFQITAEGYTVGDDESVTIQRGASHQFSSMKKMLLIK